MAGNWKEAATMGLEIAVNITESYMDLLEDILNNKYTVDLRLEKDAKERRFRWLPILVAMRNKLNELKGVGGSNE